MMVRLVENSKYEKEKENFLGLIILMDHVVVEEKKVEEYFPWGLSLKNLKTM